MALGFTMAMGSTLPVSAAESGSNVTFTGSGWGHGVGMSQYGAYGMAVTGSTSEEIIRHYYAGTAVTALSTDPIWVNLERDFETLQLNVENLGTVVGANVAITSGTNVLVAQPGATITLAATSPGCSVTVVNPDLVVQVVEDPNCIFDFGWYNWSVPGQNPTTKLAIAGCLLADWNVSPTVHRPCEYARGMLHLRSGTGGLDLSVEMLIDDYVSGVSEVPTSWPAAALGAQAIASRSYAVSRQLERGDPASNSNSCDGWCHVKDTTADQRYVGWGHQNITKWLSAVQATAGKVVTHPGAPNGVVTTYYSSSSGGLTENVEEKFGGPPREYLKSVDDSVAVDGTVVNPKATWTASFSPTVVADALGFDVLLGVKVTDTRTSGSAALMEYSGLVDGKFTVLEKTGSWARTTFGLYSEYFKVTYTPPILDSDELFFYRSTDGVFKYYNTKTSGSLGTLLQSGVYSKGWDSITAVDLDGDGRDEQFFYRSSDGVFKYYDVKPNGALGALLQSGVYSLGWDSITAVDLDGDGKDEFFFYRSTDGVFKYYDVKPNGALGASLQSGVYSLGWDSITAVDLDGDGRDEQFFYRSTDGVFKYYDVKPNGALGALLKSGVYSTGWDSITAVDLDGDDRDEQFFYRSSSGVFKYYDVKSNGALGALLQSGVYSKGWDSITAVQLD